MQLYYCFFSPFLFLNISWANISVQGRRKRKCYPTLVRSIIARPTPRKLPRHTAQHAHIHPGKRPPRVLLHPSQTTPAQDKCVHGPPVQHPPLVSITPGNFPKQSTSSHTPPPTIRLFAPCPASTPSYATSFFSVLIFSPRIFPSPISSPLLILLVPALAPSFQSHRILPWRGRRGGVVFRLKSQDEKTCAPNSVVFWKSRENGFAPPCLFKETQLAQASFRDLPAGHRLLR